MGQKYTNQTQSGYNASPPPDDGSTGSNNLITWANTKTKIGDPLLTLAQNINTALVNALDFGSRTTGINDTATASDHMRTIECTAAITETLPQASTVGAGYIVNVKNTTTSAIVTIALQAGTDTIDGIAGGTQTVNPGSSVMYKVNNAANGYYTIASFTAAVSLTPFFVKQFFPTF